MTSRPSRPDLAEMMAPLLRDLAAAEHPILEEHGLTMWAYSVLVALDRTAMPTQAALAEAINADKTRIISTLDDLQQRGFIERRPGQEDRRVRVLTITDAGRAVKDQAQAAIQRGEDRLLSKLSAADRAAFLRALQQLTGGS